MYFFWVDCEMTGLDINQDHILEIACIITDKNMNEIAKYQAVIYHEDSVLEKMSDWCKITHTSSGLSQLVRESKNSYGIVENAILVLLNKYASPNNTYIAGNSVYNDLQFIKKYMPEIAAFLHYRIFDISTFKILALKKNIPLFIKKNTHLAINDIQESIEEYHYYEKFLFKDN